MQDVLINLINDANGEINNKISPFKRLLIFAKIFNEEIKVLYDTGADLCAINKNVFRKIPINIQPRKIEDSSHQNFCSA